MAAADFEAAPVPVPLEENGFHGVPGDDNGDVEIAPLGAPELEAEPEMVARGLYMVRMPRPPMDDAELKKLQAEFQAHVAKLKAMNTKLSAKREEVRGFKRQMGEARGLKETSEPEFQEKSERMKELRALRSSYLDRIKEIKENVSGLDFKSEQELDDKIRELEYRISHEGMPLREEKLAVQQIAKLKAQRPKIKEYDLHKASLAELEAEAQKIKAIIAGMDGEFNVIKTERNATKTVVQDIYANLKKASDELAALQAEHAELAAAKESTLKALDTTRGESNANMQDFRVNRKFSLTVRDMVAAGQHEEAAELVRAQVDEMVARLSSDPEFRAEYDKQWAAQRKFPVSDLLPKSCTAPPPEANGRDAGAAGGRGAGRGGGGRGGPQAQRAPPPEPRGKEKAELLIQQLMQEASKEAAAAKARSGTANGYYEDDDDEEEAPAPSSSAPATAPAAMAPAAGAAVVKKAAPSAVGGAAAHAKLVQDPAAAAAAAFNFKVELPKVPDLNDNFVVPVIKNEEVQQSKEQVREEQVRKAQEAEDRKRKRAEQAERRKQQAAEAAKRLEQERKDRDVAARRAASLEAQQQPEEQVATGDEGAAAQAASSQQQQQQQQQASKYNAPTPFEKRQMLAAAKRPRSRNTPIKQAQSIWNQHQGIIIFAIVMLLCILLGIFFLM